MIKKKKKKNLVVYSSLEMIHFDILGAGKGKEKNFH